MNARIHALVWPQPGRNRSLSWYWLVCVWPAVVGGGLANVESIPVTERKPQGMSFHSWIDQQIDEAMERGAFDNLAGAGKPLPNRGDEDAGQAWLRDYVRREGVASEELLPTPLRLRKERERLAEAVHHLRSEREVRQTAAELNERITKWRRFPSGPAIFVPLVDEEAMVARWRDGQPEPPSAEAEAVSDQAAAIREGTRTPWWRRRRGRDRSR
jgi:hypothetical protein